MTTYVRKLPNEAMGNKKSPSKSAKNSVEIKDNEKVSKKSIKDMQNERMQRNLSKQNKDDSTTSANVSIGTVHWYTSV